MLVSLANLLVRRGADPIVVNRAISISIDGLFLFFIATLWIVGLDPITSASLSFLTLTALLITITDLSRNLIPDLLTLPGICVGLALSLSDSLVAFLNSVAGAVLLGGLLLVLTWIWDRFLCKPDAMGGGDIKLAAMIGSVLGIQLGAWAIVLGAVSTLIGYAVASLLGQRGTRVPFGPSLA